MCVLLVTPHLALGVGSHTPVDEGGSGGEKET